MGITYYPPFKIVYDDNLLKKGIRSLPRDKQLEYRYAVIDSNGTTIDSDLGTDEAHRLKDWLDSLSPSVSATVNELIDKLKTL